MEQMSILAISLTLLLSAGVDGNSHGAPLSSCQNMGAVHVVFPSNPSTNPSPFGITLSKNNIMSGDTVSLLLSPNKNGIGRIPTPPVVEGYFTGFLLMAFDESAEDTGLFGPVSNPIGHFQNVHATKGQFIDCFDLPKSAVTHINANFKQNVTVEWVAPADLTGKIIFKCTFTESISSLWAKVPSNVLVVEDDTTTGTTTAETTTETTTPETTTAETITTPETTTAETTTETTSKTTTKTTTLETTTQEETTEKTTETTKTKTSPTTTTKPTPTTETTPKTTTTSTTKTTQTTTTTATLKEAGSLPL